MRLGRNGMRKRLAWLCAALIASGMFTLFARYDILEQKRRFLETVESAEAVFTVLLEKKVRLLGYGYFTWTEMVRALEADDETFLLSAMDEMRPLGVMGLEYSRNGEPFRRFGTAVPVSESVAIRNGLLTFSARLPVRYSDQRPSPYMAAFLLDLSEMDDLFLGDGDSERFRPLFAGFPPVRFGGSGIPVFGGGVFIEDPSLYAYARNNAGTLLLVFFLCSALVVLAGIVVSRSLRLMNFEGRLLTLSSVLEERDAYTKGHAERVAMYADTLAKRLGLSTGRRRRLRIACLCHDLGKILTPEKILNKPGRLTEEEFEEIRKHPVTGRDIVRRVLEDPGIERMVECHHERWNGQGYPNGISGEQIPLEARILSVADVFDALTSERSYRGAMTAEEAYRVMEADTGQGLDPSIVAVLRLLKLPEIEAASTDDRKEAVRI